MTEEYREFVADLREKKIVARSARHKRTHTGRGGRVRLPSDNLTTKELCAMSGEVKSYKLNSPMTWAEFKTMPEDLRVDYIKLLRQKFNVPNTYLAVMFGVGVKFLNTALFELGLNRGKRSGREKWDKEGWTAWVNGVTVTPEGESAQDVSPEIAPQAFPSVTTPVYGLARNDTVGGVGETKADSQEKVPVEEGGGWYGGHLWLCAA